MRNSFLLPDALTQIHFPDSREQLDAAVLRLKFDELFLHQLMFARVRDERAVRRSRSFAIDEKILKSVVSQFPFTLTQSQKIAAWEIVQDCARLHPMNRLLEGDVGSGKTAVAALAIGHTIVQDGRVVYLTPTELLARQQCAVLQRLLKSQIGLCTRSMVLIGETIITRHELEDAWLDGRVKCVVGTHALLQDGVRMPELSLVVIDEQHRFGVEQRHALLERGELAPHLLSMTATPIPRSLALSVYGDLDLSIVVGFPNGRLPIATMVVSESHRQGMWQHVRSQIEQGFRAYVVCPLIDPSDVTGAQSVKEVGQLVSKQWLKSTRVGLLHGKMKSDEKQAVMEKFREGKLDVLVSTTVVEVGVDVPEATVMVVVGAERFGLAQLHQLRGRVGRSSAASFCYLLPTDSSVHAMERLRVVEETNDGFLLAEKDLLLRGAGNIYGNAQSGFPDFQLATPADVDLMKKARDWVARLHKEAPEFFDDPRVAERITASFDAVHLE